VSVSTCGGLIHGGGGLYSGGAYIRRFTVLKQRLHVKSFELLKISNYRYKYNTFLW
jgi:hypothetical protein